MIEAQCIQVLYSVFVSKRGGESRDTGGGGKTAARKKKA